MNECDYSCYLSAIARIMKLAIEDLGFNPDQAHGFAHNEIAPRLEKFRPEAALGLTALIICGLQYEIDMTRLREDVFFMDELREAYANQPSEQLNDPRVRSDVESVKKLFSLGNF